MADNLNKSLDEILATEKPTEKRSGSARPRQNNNRRQERDRREFPRDGIKKSYRDDRRNIDSEWVHDMFDDNNNNNRRPPRRQQRDSPDTNSRHTKLRVENVHWKLTIEDLEELFTRIGPIVKLDLKYDRSGRSEGIAYVVYEQDSDAKEAIRQFDGANANGQPIRLFEDTGARRNPFDSAPRPGRSLADRVTAPRDRSRSPPRYTEEDAARKGIDRYVPGQGGRSRSPMRHRNQNGRRPGARRDAPSRDSDGGRGGRTREGRARKTQEELDAEMEDYFSADRKGAEPAAAAPAAAPAATTAATTAIDDIDMIE